jgi:hypothetical protein
LKKKRVCADFPYERYCVAYGHHGCFQAASSGINAEAPAELARWAARHGVPLVHFSTDYVFDGYLISHWTSLFKKRVSSPILLTRLPKNAIATEEDNAKDRGFPRAPEAFRRRSFVNDDTRRTTNDARMSLTATETAKPTQNGFRRHGVVQPCECISVDLPPDCQDFRANGFDE